MTRINALVVDNRCPAPVLPALAGCPYERPGSMAVLDTGSLILILREKPLASMGNPQPRFTLVPGFRPSLPLPLFFLTPYCLVPTSTDEPFAYGL
jgi:hypothetical protein